MSRKGTEHWIHCGRCGELFQSAADPAAGIVCPACGGDPVIDPERELATTTPEEEPKTVVVVADQERRRSGKLSGLARFVIGWAIVLLLLAGVIKWFQRDAGANEATRTRFAVGAENMRVRSKAYQECVARLQAFLKEVSPERRSQFVLNPSATTVKMISSQHEDRVPAEGELGDSLHFDVIDTPRGKGVEGLWEYGDQKIEGVFFEHESEGWLLDWEAFVRYSTVSWDLFLAGVGPDEGEFRVLARRRATPDGRKDDPNSVVLVAPRQGAPQRIGAQSPSIPVDAESRLGRILSLAFEQKANGVGPYNSKIVRMDPDGMIRLRVRVKREGEIERTFRLQDIIACHWLSIDELGVAEKDGAAKE